MLFESNKPQKQHKGKLTGFKNGLEIALFFMHSFFHATFLCDVLCWDSLDVVKRNVTLNMQSAVPEC